MPLAAQKQEAILYFKDSTILKGLAKITHSKGIQFRTEKGEEKTEYSFEELKYIEIKEKKKSKEFTTYSYRILPESGYTLLKQIEVGKLNLYKFFDVFHSSKSGPNGSMTTKSSSISRYYIAKENEEILTNLGINGLEFGKRFKKNASNYFSDCPELVLKIQKKKFKKKHIVEVVKFYNENCD
ncbi:MAG TPA: hypothetical protein DDZ39_08275 [Flavobacteriaceae bacterium]|nr:hypothetical protein [Flavobacteriaceae bacterium]HBS10954.1 hypothetical protein [Flavobacteriaceae bacterium]